MTIISTEEPIDAVITWVDGKDEAHIAKLAEHLLKKGITRPVEAAPTRFNQCNEIEYAVKSLLRFAPWLRTIFIVTDKQTPSILTQLRNTPFAEKVKIIDHREIFYDYEPCLPVFNSLAIESVVWRIPGLADRFIYCNDDFFLIKPVTREDFFRGDKVVLRGTWKMPKAQQLWVRMKRFFAHCLVGKAPPLNLDPHRIVQEKTATLAGFDKKFFHLPHCPLPLHKPLLAQFFQAHPEMLAQNVSFSFRNQAQFWLMSLAHHLEIKNKKAIIDNSLQTVYINNHLSADKIYARMKYAEKNAKATFLCLQSLDEASDSMRNFLFAWLNNCIQWEPSS